MNLRLRLLSVIAAVAVPAGIASWISYRMHLDVRQELAQISPKSKVELDARSLVGRALSIEGRWSDDGVFDATSVEELPWSRRPKLRGAVQAVRCEDNTVAMFGREITITDETEFEPAALGEEPLADLERGQRIEISCKVDRSGAWLARRIRTRAVKLSDKIKGEITRDVGAPDARLLEIEGLTIRVPSTMLIDSPRGPVHRMELASQMALSVQECLTASHELLQERYRLDEALAKGDGLRVRALDAARENVEDRLRDSCEEFTQLVARSKAIAEQESLRFTRADAERASDASEASALRLVPLEEQCTTLAASVVQFITLARADPNAAQDFLPGALEPQLRNAILPLVHAYQLETEEELRDQIKGLARHSEAAARVAVTASVAGLLLALTLGSFVARSIAKAVDQLRSAALSIGAGDLAARVTITSGDELGLLGRTFNRMAAQLAATTVSIDNLNEVIDSMAGALFLLEPDGKIASVNPAAASLLGYGPGELVGMHVETVCPGVGARFAPTWIGEPVASGEQVFRTRDGAVIPVWFSCSALGGEHGPIRGHACLAQDLSVLKRMEEDLRHSLAEKELLLREVHHRVKNNLQVISSLLDLQSRAVADPLALEKFQESQDRIRSMVLIHEQLYGSRDFESIEMRAYIELLTASLLRSHVDRPERIRLRVAVEDIHLPLDRALACGLIVNELVTNAFKHAFPTQEPGEVRVACRRTSAGTIALEVSDNGRGFVEEAGGKFRESLGLSLVEALVKQLRGRRFYDGESGSAFRVEFPDMSLAAVS